MADALKVLLGFATKSLNVSEDDLKEILVEDAEKGVLKEGALDALLAKDSKRVSDLKDDYKSKNDDHYNRGKSEALTKLEGELKSEFSIESDKNGLELVQEVVNQKVTKAKEEGGGGDKTITDEDVQNHQLLI